MKTFQTVCRAFAFALFASASSVASAAACVSDSLSNYLGLSDCSINGVSFSSFTTAFDFPSGATPINASSITVTPLSSAGQAGFAFTLADGISASASQVFEILFGFRATPQTGVALSDSQLQLLGDTVVQPDGVIRTVQNLCVDGSFSASLACSGTQLDAIVFDIGVDSEKSQNLALPIAGFLSVVLDLAVDGGLAGSALVPAGGGTSTLFTVATAGTVPEPTGMAFIVMVVALLLLAPGCARISAAPQP
ncbi:MAG TPA: hypothetical protein VFB54_15105 [Burkholderiales bacterium]|nr:hypothetical protein [Burkholderiales bacterium]